MTHDSTAAGRQARAVTFALTLPGAWEDHPWGETVAKVGKKVFAFLGHPESPPGMSVKLPHSLLEALETPGAKPTGYGLGKAGWVTVPFSDAGPTDAQVQAWIEESWQAVAPKKLLAARRS